MAQTAINSYCRVRKRAADHASVKRRKLTEDSRLDIPVVTEEADIFSIPSVAEKVVPGVKVTSTKGKQKRSSRVAAGTRSCASSLGRKGKQKARTSEKTIQTLLDIVAQAQEKSKEQTLTVSDDQLCEEDPLPRCGGPTGVALEESASDAQQLLSCSPQKHKVQCGYSTPSKLRTIDGRLEERQSISSPFKALQPSPFRGSSINLDPPSTSPSVANLTSKFSPMKLPQLVESRGAAFVRLAKEKMGKSPTKFATPSSSPKLDGSVLPAAYKERVKKMAARRRLLIDPDMDRGRGEGKEEVQRATASATKPPRLQEFRALEIESPKKSARQQPAYERYRSLVDESPVPPSSPSVSVELPLPHKYQVLAEKFRCTDTVVTMLQKRKEICTLEKLKQSVQEMSRRSFEKRNLAQMKTVYPSAFIFRQEKNIPGNYDRKKYEQFQLTIESNTDEDGSGECVSGGGSKVGGCLGASALISRRKVFNRNLAQIVRRHHKTFLASLSPPLVIPDEKILRWHPSFSLDTIPDVEEADLPKPPITETHTTARDVLNIAHNKVASRVQLALASVARESEGDVKRPSVPKATVDPALKGVSEALLEKIRQKEAVRAKATITRDPLKEKKLEMLGRLPEFCRILRVFFLAEKKAAIPWDDVVLKLRESHTSCLHTDQTEEHLRYLEQLVPSWMKSVTIRSRRYIKLTRNIDAKFVIRRLEDEEKELKV